MKNNKKIYFLLLFLFILWLFRNFFNTVIINQDDLLHANIINSAQVKELKEENEQLKAELNFNVDTDYEMQISKVKYRNIYDFQNEITIFKGKDDGVKMGDAIINQDGLVGIVTAVKKNTTTVRLLTNKKTNVSVKINNAYGLLKVKDKQLVVSNITNYDEVMVNDAIYTSGLGNLPGDILIGYVTNIQNDALEIEKIITVKWAVNFDILNYVYIMGAK